MKKIILNLIRLKKLIAVLLLLICFKSFGQATDPSPQSLPFTQDFSGLLHSSTIYPTGIQGWILGVNSPGLNFRLTPPTGNANLKANSGAQSVNATQIHNYNGKIGFLHSGASESSVATAIITTGLNNIQVNYNVMTIRNPYDGSMNTRISENILQYRIGNIGNFTNITSVAYQTNTTLQTVSGVTSPQNLQSRSVVLPVECNNQSLVQLRWVSRDFSGAGNRPSVAIDDINIKSISPIITTTGALSALSTTYGTASADSSFSFTGANLTSDVTLTAPSGFEISTTQFSGYSSTLTVPIVSGSISTTTIYVRLTATTITGTYSGNITLSGFSSVTNTTATASIASVSSVVSQKELTISGITISDKNFDGNTSASIIGTPTLVGIVNSDQITLEGSPVANFNDATVGNNKLVTISGYTFTGTNESSYFLLQPTGLTGNILSSGLSDQTIIFGTLSTVTYGDPSLNLTATSDSGLAIFYSSSNTNVAIVNGNTVTIVGAGSTIITASQAGDSSYNPAIPVNQILTVYQKQLTVTGAMANNKIYDGTTSASISGGALNGVIGADNVSFTGNGTFNTSNVASNIVVIGNLSLTGMESDNYTLEQPSLIANISAKEVNVIGISISNKEYDNTTSALILGTPSLDGVILGDVSNVILEGSPTAMFLDAAVGNAKPVSVSGYSISGGASSNYLLIQPSNLTANIILRNLSIVGLTAVDKVYDRTNNVDLIGNPILNGIISGDELNISLDGVPTASFIDSAVGINKTVSVSGLTISGFSVINYNLNSLSLTATISPSEVTIDNAYVSDKNYDGTTVANLTGTLIGVLSPDEVTLNLTAQFDNSFVGNDKQVTSTSTLSGLDAGNYVLIQPINLTASILALPCTNTNGLVNWNFTSGSSTGSTPLLSTQNVSVSNIVPGQTNGTATYITSVATSTGYTDASGTFNVSVPALVGALNISTSTYHEFTLTPSPGFVYTFSSMSFGSRSTGSGPQLYSLRSSLDEYSTNLASGSMPNNSVWNLYTPTVSLTANQSQPITFRLYGSNGSGAPAVGVSNWRIDDIILNISVSPSTALSSSLIGTICSGNSFNYTPTTNYTGASISWTRAAVTGINNEAIVIPQTNNPNEVLVNTTNTPIDVTYSFKVTNLTCFVVQDVTITVNPSTIVTEQSACENYFWSASGQTYNTSGTYSTVTNLDGCSINETLVLTINTPITFYQDFDNDGYGNGAIYVIDCLQPSGYVSNNTDCNDAFAAVNPGHVEVLYNGVDDNCDGQLDEGFQLTTTLQSVSCGATVPSMGSLIYANINNTASGYRFKVVNNATGATQIINRSFHWFALNMLADYDYATTYTISVELQKAGIWLGYYGSTCDVSSPAVLSPTGVLQVNPSQCGATLPSIGSVIATTPLSGATGYRFRVTDVTPGATGANLIQVKDRSYHWFTLPMLSRFNYGSTYLVEVAVKTTAGYSAYGSACTVITPAAPTLVNCGAIVPTASSLVYTSSLNSVSQYRFQVTKVSDQSAVTFDTNKFWFSFRVNVPGYTPEAGYSVRVAVMTAGTWSPFGDACEIVSPTAAARSEEVSAFDIQLLAYPNPFTSEFKLTFTTSTEGAVELKVYDMLGKLVEAKSINTIDYISEELGSAYPAGVYNVIVTQGENAKTLRMIKR